LYAKEAMHLFPKTKITSSLLTVLLIGILFATHLSPLFAQVGNFGVSATVPPVGSDFQFGVTAEDTQTTFPEYTTLTYKITYGAKPSAEITTQTTLVADWYAAIGQNNAVILDYVSGSATNAYGNTSPVIDPLNHTITWTIPNLPAGMINQTVTFKLRINDNDTETNPVDFSVKGKMNNPYVTLSDQTPTQIYQFDESLITPTPTLTPTAAPFPTATAAPSLLRPTSARRSTWRRWPA